MRLSRAIFAYACVALIVASRLSANIEYNAITSLETSFGYIFTLETTSSDPRAISPLNVTVSLRSESTVHFKIVDPSNNRWEVPDVVQQSDPSDKPRDTFYDVEFTMRPFTLTITRKGERTPVFQLSSLVFHDQYIEFGTTSVPDFNLYGLGERVESLRLNNARTYTLFNTDNPTPELVPLYGSQPFYLEQRVEGAHGLLFLNSNAMDVVLSASPTPTITFKTVGGIVDSYIFVGLAPEDIIKQYHKVIGTPTMYPYWSLGFHQSRFGYENLTVVKDVVQKFQDNRLPLDAMWVDIDYMDNYKVFTTDPEKYEIQSFGEFSENLVSDGKRLFLIVDPGIKVESGYDIYEDTLTSQVFIQDPLNSALPAYGKVWPRACIFPDFTKPQTEQYWQKHLGDFYEKVKFGGVWIDMNEIASFCDGRCIIDVKTEEDRQDLYSCTCAEQYPASKYNDVDEYFPGGPDARPSRSNATAKLDKTSLHMESRYHLGIEYDIHNMYGHFEAKVTKIAYENIVKERSSIITRANFPGTGRYAGHWLGDNESKYVDMKDSITGIINYNMFGIPFVGADVCGFIGNSDAELCTRWMQLGIFYMFYRNHNNKGQTSQEPYVFDSATTDINRQTLNLRYKMIPYFYTLLRKVHLEGGTMIRPLFFNYRQDRTTWAIDKQFMVSDILLVSPVLEAGVSRLDAYFPGGLWYDWYSGAVEYRSVEGGTITVQAPLERIPIHIRESSVIPLQGSALNTIEARKTPYELVVAVNLDSPRVFTGELYIDDGLSQVIDETNSRTVTFEVYFDDGDLKIKMTQTGRYATTNPLGAITFYGLAGKKLSLEGGYRYSVVQDQEKQIMSITGLTIADSVILEIDISNPGDDDDDDDNDDDDDDEDDDDEGVDVGLAVGLTFGISAAVGAAAFVFYRSRGSSRGSSTDADYTSYARAE
eukprot:TRINITY_DN1298_c0_g1_i1.p1 TRINITY_DN1298_c0_g1~~TRINITY_DN1298_c0_g1_i1.p1  ORF type:complete len:931 (-),score=192.17 TRINITY_DN1298_c0_g1_i1:187-2979(-)